MVLNTKAARLATSLYLVAASTLLHAAEMTIPLTVRYALLTQEVARQVYTDPGGIARVWRESDCRFLTLDRPKFGPQGERLRFSTHGIGSLGADVLEKCLGPGQWRGNIESLMETEITPEWQLKLRIVESSLYDEQWRKGLLSGLLWEVTKRFVYPKLTALSIDLAPPRDEVLSLLKVWVPSSAATQIKAILDSAFPKNVEVREHGLVVSLVMNVPDRYVRPTPSPTHPEPPLSPMEIQTYQQAFERWDAFLVFVVKGFGETSSTRLSAGSCSIYFSPAATKSCLCSLACIPAVRVTRFAGSLFRRGKACMRSFRRARNTGSQETNCCAMWALSKPVMQW